MVKLEEVPDEDFIAQQQGPKIEEEDDWDTDSGTLPFTYTLASMPLN